MSKLNKDELALVYLDYMGVSRKRMLELLSCCKHPSTILDSDWLKSLEHVLGKEKSEEIASQDIKVGLRNIDKYLSEEAIGAVTIISEDYPESLLNISDPPVVLYYVGDLSLTLSPRLLGVVGTRKPTNYGRSVTEKFVSELVTKGEIVTISGLAYGIDSEVARTTLENNGKTIAVLGGGIKKIYPSSNVGLAERIVRSGGLVISEYFPTLRPTQYTFPERNRIISGLSRGVLVIEAGLKSGSLITANFAIEQGRELFVVPGNINNVGSMGSNKLIEELPHTFTSSTLNIFKSFGVSLEETPLNIHQYSLQEQAVIEALMNGEKSVDELCEILREDYKTLNLLLTEMEIGGIIKKLTGDYYSV